MSFLPEWKLTDWFRGVIGAADTADTAVDVWERITDEDSPGGEDPTLAEAVEGAIEIAAKGFSHAQPGKTLVLDASEYITPAQLSEWGDKYGVIFKFNKD